MTRLPAIHIKTVKANQMRYSTAGDYLDTGSSWYIRVAKTDDWRHSALVLAHELIEMLVTKHHGIDWSAIDAWDMTGPGKDSDDPGAMPDAPYHREHMFAEKIERILAEELGVDWNEYNSALDALNYRPEQ